MIGDRRISWRSPFVYRRDPSTGRLTLSGTLQGTVTVSDSMNDTEARIFASGVVISGLENHPDLPQMVRTMTHIERIGPSIAEWKNEYEYSSPDDAEGIQPPRPDFVSREWSVRIATEETIEQIDRDYLGTPIVKITGELFDPPITDEFQDMVLIFTTENVPFNDQLIAEFRNCINENPFIGYSPGMCRMAHAEATTRISTTPPHYSLQVMAAVAIRFEGPQGVQPWNFWDKRILAEGFYVINQTTGAIERGKTVNRQTGQATSIVSEVPVLHSPVNGQQILDPQQAEFYMIKTKRPKDFNRFFRDMLG